MLRAQPILQRRSGHRGSGIMPTNTVGSHQAPAPHLAAGDHGRRLVPATGARPVAARRPAAGAQQHGAGRGGGTAGVRTRRSVGCRAILLHPGLVFQSIALDPTAAAARFDANRLAPRRPRSRHPLTCHRSLQGCCPGLVSLVSRRLAAHRTLVHGTVADAPFHVHRWS